MKSELELVRPCLALDWVDRRGPTAHPVIRDKQAAKRSLLIPLARSCLVILVGRPCLHDHNIEEYGVDLLGRTHYFPDALCSTLGAGRYPACPIPPPFFLAVNISLIWIAAPFAALLSRRHPLIGFIFYGLLITNGVTHVVPMLLGKGYNPGALTAMILFCRRSFGSHTAACSAQAGSATKVWL